MVTISLERKSGDYGFEIKDQKGHSVKADTGPDNGGENYGFRPMQLVLAALGSCSAIDLVSILKKQRQEIDDLKMEIHGERQEDVIPSLWKQVNVIIQLTGNINEEKARRAAELSMEKYCSVAETLRRGGTKIHWEIIVKAREEK